MKPEIKWVGATDFRAGRQGHVPIAIVNHIMVGTMGGTRQHFNNPNDGVYVSAHFGVGKDGSIEQYVRLSDTAFHCGIVKAASWPLLIPGENPNSYVVGIEHEGYAEHGLTEEQYQATLSLHKWLIYEEIPRIFNTDITPTVDTIIGHYRINSIDKAFCPGPLFPFERLIKEIRPYTTYEEVEVEVGDHKIKGWIPKGAGRIQIQLRELANAFNANLTWDEKKKKAKLDLFSAGELRAKINTAKSQLEETLKILDI